MQTIADFLAQQPSHLLPGLVIGYQYGYDDAVFHAYGVDGSNRPIHPTTLFPVASITKLATALAVLRLVDTSQIALDAPIGNYVTDIHPEMAPRRIRSLLCHTSGYALDLPNKDGRYALGLTWDTLAQECLTVAPVAPENHIVQYSNLGYGILGIILERVTGQSCADALRTLVLLPRGITGILGDPGTDNLATIADVRGQHRGTMLETFNSAFWRSLALPWGGLCTDAAGALALINAFMPLTNALSYQLQHDATQNQTGTLAGGFMAPLLWDPCPWGLGVELRGQKSPHWVSQRYAPHSFGHSGSSGMLVWADPDHLFRVVILGSRAADSGWLLRQAPKLTDLVWQSVISD